MFGFSDCWDKITRTRSVPTKLSVDNELVLI